VFNIFVKITFYYETEIVSGISVIFMFYKESYDWKTERKNTLGEIAPEMNKSYILNQNSYEYKSVERNNRSSIYN